MPELLSEHIRRIEEFEREIGDRDIIVSRDYEMEVLSEDYGVKKTPIPWPLYRYNLFYIVDVPANAEIPSHVHDEAVFRYVISGSLTFNGDIHVSAGEWCVVKAGVSYGITTETGYRVVAAYGWACGPRFS